MADCKSEMQIDADIHKYSAITNHQSAMNQQSAISNQPFRFRVTS
jgi:hypothetical protein